MANGHCSTFGETRLSITSHPESANRPCLPPGQQLVAAGKWPTVGERLPRRDSSPWTVQVCQQGDMLRTLSLHELRALGVELRRVDIHCVTRWSKLDVAFEGVRLAAVLAACGISAANGFVSFVARSSRGHSTSLAMADTVRLDPLVALAADGQPLSEERGGPVRVVVPDRYFYKSLKWLERIEVLDEDRLGYWESTAGYHNLADPWQEQRYLAATIAPAEARRILQQRDLRGRDLLSLVATGLSLPGLQAEGAQLRNADFRNCQLPEANFAGANLSNAHFLGADLRRGNFSAADLEGADFAGADLRGANFGGSRLFGASLVDASSGRAPLVDTQTRFDLDSLNQLVAEQERLMRELMQRV